MQFPESLDGGLERISENPLHYVVIIGGIRRKLLNKFPFGLFYIFEINEVRVLAVLQHAQNPEILKSRK